jgi:hypothetical protein
MQRLQQSFEHNMLRALLRDFDVLISPYNLHLNHHEATFTVASAVKSVGLWWWTAANTLRSGESIREAVAYSYQSRM